MTPYVDTDIGKKNAQNQCVRHAGANYHIELLYKYLCVSGRGQRVKSYSRLLD